ncbi:MAG: TRAP transporter small permease [Calditrichales bacterium]|nr:MAG: TRAP transporter small permease [Calditrichales bacterium]
MYWIEKINAWVERAESAVLVLVLVIMVVLSFLQVILRNLFDQGILWGDIFLRHLVLWVGFLGASLATREKKHINIDLFNRFLSERGKAVSLVITSLFSAFVCVVLTDASWTFVLDEKMIGTTVFEDIPSWYFQVIIPIGFLLMALRFLVQSAENVVKLTAPKEGGKS